MTLYDEIKAMRLMWAESDAKRDAGIPEPEGIRKIEDIVYAASVTKEEEPWHLTDIYYSEPWEGDTYPVIVSIHGGGWFYGDKKLYSLYTKYLASQGFAVVNFNYRLAPEYQYPCGFLDCCRLMDFLARNAEEYRLDMNRLYMVGDSAGAQLVSQYSIFATSEEYRNLFEEAKGLTAPVPAKVALNCGVYELYGREDSRVSENYLPAQMPEKIEESILHILDYVNKDFPETFLMASVNDNLLPASAVIRKKLDAVSVPYEYHEYGQTNPADAHVFHVNLRSAEGVRCNKEELAFFTKIK